MKLIAGGDPAKTNPGTTTSLRDAMHRAVTASENYKAHKDSCPDCKKRAALLSLVFRGIRVGRLCRFCPFSSFNFVEEPKSKGSGT